jgi:hypothetical protein
MYDGLEVQLHEFLTLALEGSEEEAVVTSRYHPPFWSTKIYYCVHNGSQLNPILRQLNPLHTIHLPSTYRLLKLSLLR